MILHHDRLRFVYQPVKSLTNATKILGTQQKQQQHAVNVYHNLPASGRIMLRHCLL